MSADHDCDVAIVGGGLAGASLALALAKTPFKVALIEAAPPPAGEAGWDERCIAINAASQRIFAGLGIWDVLEAEAEPITSTHISERGRFGVARFTAADAGLPALGYNVPVRAMGQLLWQRAQVQDRLTILCPARVDDLQATEDHAVLALGKRRLKARLIVAADGAHSGVRKLLGVGAEERDYVQSAIVTAVRLLRTHKGCAYERFTPDGPIALLPKPVLSPVEGPGKALRRGSGQACSLVWTVAAERVETLLALSDEDFLREAQEIFGERLGRFAALGRRAVHPLSRTLSEKLSAPRVLLAGNAAQSLHPVAAQGFNLGLRDIATIAEVVAGAADPGSPDVLDEYTRRRARDRQVVSGFTDHLVRLFSNRIPGLRGLRHLGLLALDLMPPLKDAVMWQNLGYTAAPALARKEALESSPEGKRTQGA